MQIVKDRGLAWLVLAASALSHAFSIGISFGALGSLTTNQVNHFGVSLTSSAWVSSVHGGLFFMLSPLASFMLKKLSPRWVQIIGGVCSTLGFSCCYFATQLWHMHISMGLVAGWGQACAYTASSEILAYHFERHIYLASSVAVLGFYLGFSFIPSVTQLLFSNIGFSLTMLVIGSSQLLHIVASIVYFPRNTNANERKQAATNTAFEEEKEDSQCKNRNSEEIARKFQNDGDQNQTIELSESEQTGKSMIQIVGSLLTNKRVGLDVKDAVMGQTIIGLTAIAGVILICATSQLKYDRIITQMGTTMIYGLMALLSAFSTGKEMYFILMAIFGTAFGAHIANLLAVAYYICGPDEMVILFGLELFAEGVGTLIGAPTFSALGVATERKYGIIAAGIMLLLSGASLIPATFVRCRKQEQNQTETDINKVNVDLLDINKVNDDQLDINKVNDDLLDTNKVNDDRLDINKVNDNLPETVQ